MLSKLTSKNQLTIPKEIIKNFPTTEYFEIVAENGRMILTPARIGQAEVARQKMVDLGITQDDVNDAINWARSK